MTFIRQIRAEDWQKYKALRMEAVYLHPEAFASTYEYEVAKTDEQWQSRVQSAAQSTENTILVADNQCQLVGMLGLRRLEGKFNHVALIWGMYVQADYRGQNLGRALVQEGIAWARRLDGLKKLRLEVNAVNTPAHKLYLSRGFKETGRLYKEMNVGGQLCDIVLMEMFIG